MTPVRFDFAKCTCGHLSPIRPTSSAPREPDPRWSGMDTNPLIVACSACKLVSKFLPNQLQEIDTEMGVAPYNPEAPMRVFRVPIECDEIDCRAQGEVLVTLSATTTAVELAKEMVSWWWKDLTCLSEHPIPDREQR